MYDEYLDEFMPSFEMKEYLKHRAITPENIIQIIYYSPFNIKRKLTALHKLQKEFSKDDDIVTKGITMSSGQVPGYAICKACINAIEMSLKAIEDDGVFTIDRHDLDYDLSKDINRGLEFNEGVFAKWSHVTEFIESVKEEYSNPEYYVWYSIWKWKKDESGRLYPYVRYIMVRDEVWLIDIDDKETSVFNSYAFESKNLNVPVPFAAGDIVEVNPYPFGPGKRIVILDTGRDIGTEKDCCALQGLFKTGRDKWRTGALKHSNLFYDTEGMVSILYTMKICREELYENESLLQLVRDFIRGRDEKGRWLWNQLHALKANLKNEFSEADIRRIIGGANDSKI